MKTLMQLISAFLLSGLAMIASAQTIVGGEIRSSSPNFISPSYQDVTIGRLGAREHGFHLQATPPIEMTCMTSTNGAGGSFWPLTPRTSPEYKAFRETMQMAVALKRKVRVYTNACARFGDTATSTQYPVIVGLDLLPAE